MAAIYLQRWVGPMGASPNEASGKLTVGGDTWARGLVGLGPDQLGRGLEACATSKDPWPPSLPVFRALCLGIPSLAAVREDLKRKDEEREPFTIMVYRRLDGWAYRHADAKHAEKLLTEAYDEAFDAVMRGEPLPERLTAIKAEKKVPKPASPETVAAEREKIRAFLKGEE